MSKAFLVGKQNALGFYRSGVLSVPSPSKCAHLLKIKSQQGFRQTTELSANKSRFCFHLKLASLSSHSITLTSTITTTAVWGRKHSPHRLQAITKGSQSRDSGRDLRELLCGLSHSLLSLSYSIQHPVPRVALLTWAGTTHILSWAGLSHTDLLMGQSDGGIFSTEVPSSEMTIVCVKLKKTHVHMHTRTPTHTRAHMHTYTRAHMYMCTHAHVHTHAHTH